MQKEDNSGILLTNGEDFRHKAFVFGKTLKSDGRFASGKLLIPLGRYVSFL